MMIQLHFTDVYRYPDDVDGITIPVMLSYGSIDIRVQAKVDTGAGVCLFSYEDGLKLGIQVAQGTPLTLRSLGGPLEAFGHEVLLQTGDLVFQSFVYFAKYPGLLYNILGREGWLRKVRLAVIDYDNLLYLSSYDS
ncbi:MAG: hypothetical protein J2P21_06755 [Chloracidobacterium sp.]|nr:hypothetical protein [Chloracidobacterium sp.]